tara:strand:- start:315 stop:704 length:390 start_codon:yes stop_codon:yes gene_type:complete
MKTSELKKVLKPLIKQCIKEVIFEDGVLSGIITEVVKGVGTAPIVEEKKPMFGSKFLKTEKSNNKTLEEQRKRMLDAIGKDTFNGVNVFEGVEPTLPESDSRSPLSDVPPGDPGVDISGLFNSNWSKMI